MKKALLLSLPITLIGIAVSLSFRIYLAHTLDTKTQTYYYTTIDLASLMAIVFIGFRSSMTVSYQKSKDADKITNIFFIILIIFTVLAMLLASYPIHIFVDSTVPTAYIAMLFLVFGFYIYYTNRLAMFRLYKSINLISLLESPLIILYFFMLSYISPPLESLIFAVMMQNITIAAYVKIANRQVMKEPKVSLPRFDDATKVYLRNSILSSIEFVFGITFIYLGIFCAKLYFGLDELGLYQVVIKPIFMYAIMLFVFPIVKFVFPELSMLINEDRTEEILKIKKWLQKYALLATLSIFITIFIFGKNGIIILFGAEYGKSYYALLILVPALYFAIMNAFYISALKAYGRFFESLIARSSSVLFFLIIFFILQSFKSNFFNIMIAISLSYVCINMVCIRLLYRHGS